MRESAAARYAHVDLTSRIASAGPHELVTILYDRLLASHDAMLAAASVGATVRFRDARLRALQALHALLQGLDPAAGDLAVTLARLYRGMLATTGSAEMGDGPAKLAANRATIAELADAWKAIANR